MAVLVTGDLHGPRDIHRLSGTEFPTGQTLTKNDFLVIAGDFGLVWDWGAEELFWRDWLEHRPWTTLFLDGNHENFEALSGFPLEERFGGPVRVLSDSVIYLQRGHVYNLQGSSVFCMGGASSVDKDYRIPGESWWPQELPTAEEYALAERNLDACDWRVDYVITHCCASSIIPRVYGDEHIWQGPDELTDWLEYVQHKLIFKSWYFGHHHKDLYIAPDHRCLFYDIVRLGEYGDIEA